MIFFVTGRLVATLKDENKSQIAFRNVACLIHRIKLKPEKLNCNEYQREKIVGPSMEPKPLILKDLAKDAKQNDIGKVFRTKLITWKYPRQLKQKVADQIVRVAPGVSEKRKSNAYPFWTTRLHKRVRKKIKNLREESYRTLYKLQPERMSFYSCSLRITFSFHGKI